MANLILFLLASVGLSHILVESTICDPLRTWFKDRSPKEGDPCPKPLSFKWLCGKTSYILGCYQCSGVWSGWIMAGFILTSWNVDVSIIYNLFTNLAVIIPAGFAASIISNLVAILLTYLEANSLVK
ncbi:MAG: DUF1360 domain-containing protein [Proteobacteria bacterium]|jgi:hypothetical protein|nr:DUF1360 domain-containing protein [Pseudomonadota bacterium]